MKNKHILRTLTLVLAVLAAGQGSAWAETRTVTYTMTSVERSKENITNYIMTFTRSGDDPFDASATTYTCTVAESGLSSSGGAGSFLLTLADGFTFYGSWISGSNVAFWGNNLCLQDSQTSGKKFSFSLRCKGKYYYVTNAKMVGREGTWSNIDYDSVWNDDEWNFRQDYNTAYSFGALTITYTDVPLISIFESDGENIYKIKSKHDLYHLANYVNNGKNPCNGLTFLQMKDIVCDDTYMPIGYYKSSSDYADFRGTYDGGGFTISGITITCTGNTSADGYIGLFGCVNSGGTVQKVVIANSNFTGYCNIGGIVGYNMGGTVKNCRVESSVTINAGTDGAYNHGGIVGSNDGSLATVIGCYSAATVSKNGKSNCQCYGGIVGNNYGGTVKNCFYAGTTVTADDKKGAIIGYDQDSDGVFSNNYYTSINLGGVGAEDSSRDQDGARRARTVTLGENVSISRSRIVYSVSGLTAIGSDNYAMRYGTAIYSGAGQTLTLSYTASAPDGFAFNGYSVKDANNQDVTVTETSGTYTFVMPDKNVTVTAIVERTGIGSIQYNSTLGAYEINCVQHLRDLSVYVNGQGNYSTGGSETHSHTCAGLVFKMTADIDFAPTSAWDDYGSRESNFTAIGGYEIIGVQELACFSGTFDGQNHTISGLRIYSENICRGLFGYIEGGTVQNVTLADARICGSTATGGIVGLNPTGTITNCHVAHDVTICATCNTNDIPVYHIGGIVGCNGSTTNNGIGLCTVSDCTSAAVITLVNLGSCSDIGGIAGINQSGGTVSGCSAVGVIVPKLSNSGAIVGQNDGTVSGNTYHSSMVGTAYVFNIGTGNGDVAGGTTLVTTELWLYDNRDNSALIAAYKSGGAANGISSLNVTLKGRTLYRDGKWNTICLPFDFSSFNGSVGNPAAVLTLRSSDCTSYNAETGALTVTFANWGNYIDANKPYLIKWNSGTDIVDPVFKSVALDKFSTDGASSVQANYASNYKSVRLTGTLAPLTSTSGKLLDPRNTDNRAYYCYMTISAPDVPEGSSFTGWYTAADGSGSPVTGIIPFDGGNASFTIYARQFSNTPTLTCHLYEGRYWVTFYHETLNFRLPAGAQAFTMDAEHHLYRVGTDGSIIPAGVAVVIIADASALTAVAAGSGILTLAYISNPSAASVVDHAPDPVNNAPTGGNILHGTSAPVVLDGDGKVPIPGADPAATGTPYVLSLAGNPAALGFYKYTGDTIPANKAYYVE